MSHRLDIAEPKKRLAHGRVAQTILIALMICTLNLQIRHDWQRTTGSRTPDLDQPPSDDAGEDPSRSPATRTAARRNPPDEQSCRVLKTLSPGRGRPTEFAHRLERARGKQKSRPATWAGRDLVNRSRANS
ncbi:hypothetical protein GCM10010193_39190 [Kitasatospora atroaurantiaca]|uniref:Uncharacterized protein n=1 Tax=Kitasatospora atroaurantiaca TaxID=285545 RepID=A0A561EU56_9ACTN|nr:hypothetical protein [Kitasatospora atroaurantiaca]TWE19148.1 hypothetical protein FB465_4256 [Kitasatospora atroaurantiaca]